MAQQRHSTNEFDYSPNERNIYGSSRLGRNSHKVDMLSSTPNNANTYVAGEKFYELSNHLGNVLTVISDIKYPIEDNGYVDYFETHIVSIADYSGFGVQLDGRTNQSDSYRYGFQGQEKDDEIKGAGNSYTTEFRQYDPRVGRWLSVDPLAHEFPWSSPYVVFDNNPIYYVDPDGQKPIPPKFTLPLPSLYTDLTSSNVLRTEWNGFLWHRKDNFIETDLSSLDLTSSKKSKFVSEVIGADLVRSVSHQKVTQEYKASMTNVSGEVERTTTVFETKVTISTATDKVLSVEHSYKSYKEKLLFLQTNGICSDEYSVHITRTTPKLLGEYNYKFDQVQDGANFSTGDSIFDNKINDAFKKNKLTLSVHAIKAAHLENEMSAQDFQRNHDLREN
ncbi:MAG: RHS repeat-associated core domain-containing protein [Crocinitomicaceae bacterium]|nr:RHS repeat-associated core domain-containing protein [Crocinitomicaceae bacterium]